jgi:two-component system LytT family response regulator
MLRAIIVDDEELSVKRLQRILAESDQIEICQTFLNPLEAYKFVQANPIEVAFLDISMPEINGMSLSSLLLAHDAAIDVVFVTGYDNYAVQAFDMSALDYLLKPVTAERLERTLVKLSKKQRSAAAVEPRITVLLFNGLKIYRTGQEPLKLRSPKTEELFAYLACKKRVSREDVIDTLWSGMVPEKALKNLNSTLYYIRKAISTIQIGNYVQSDSHEIWIEESSIYCDLYEFEQVLKQIRLAPEQSADLFKRAEVLYAGELLKGKAYEWAYEQARRLEQNYIELLEAAGSHHLMMNQHQKALYYYGEILKLDAIREDISHEVIRIYMVLGRDNEALRQYRLLEELLQRELGTKPNHGLQTLIMKLL